MLKIFKPSLVYKHTDVVSLSPVFVLKKENEAMDVIYLQAAPHLRHKLSTVIDITCIFA